MQTETDELWNDAEDKKHTHPRGQHNLDLSQCCTVFVEISRFGLKMNFYVDVFEVCLTHIRAKISVTYFQNEDT